MFAVYRPFLSSLHRMEAAIADRPGALCMPGCWAVRTRGAHIGTEFICIKKKRVHLHYSYEALYRVLISGPDIVLQG